MAWTRYDDGFPSHPKTLDVKASCRAALALHLLCNTWSASTDTPGMVPLAAVIDQGGGKAQGQRWARALVAAGMWHAGGHDCARCPEPPAGGYVIHDFVDYNPQDVRQKRAEAGRKGAAARWGTVGKSPDGDGNGMASAIALPPESHGNGVAKNGIARGHPVPVPKPVNPSAQAGTYVATVDAGERAPEPGSGHSEAGALAAHYAAGVPLTDHARATRTIAAALEQGIAPDLIRTGLDRLVVEQRSCTPDQLRIAILAAPGSWQPAASRPSTTDQRVRDHLDLAAQLRAEEAGEQPHLRALPGGAA